MSSRLNTSLDTRIVNSFSESFRRSGSMRAAVDFTHPVSNVLYEKEEGLFSPTQSDTKRRTEPINNQINVISSNDDNACYEEMQQVHRYVELHQKGIGNLFSVKRTSPRE
ncbi:hypothetical protein E6C27_scaffold93G001150 [Cucumis melo var. makuwa]|uniref:Uncharacterized protein n=1 Tax=Cucumis melo var. makuwa TaxID=1194695 RepID=A0A5A7TJU6_CUCMM|nr:hypothetical protein E6C27_scaffold93G001150 [Cucumis melo var. makuwa]